RATPYRGQVWGVLFKDRQFFKGGNLRFVEIKNAAAFPPLAFARRVVKKSRPRAALVTRGLDPRVHHLRKTFAKKMDCRVKPGNDHLPWKNALIEPRARAAHDLAPFFRIRADQFGEFLGRAARELIADRGEPLAECRRLD